VPAARVTTPKIIENTTALMRLRVMVAPMSGGQPNPQ
jgi:hypothetical protein